MIPRVLTIAGSDSSGGAGIQADLKTFTVFRVYGMSAVTALTAQNTVGVSAIHPVPADFVRQQIDAVCTDIGVDAVKTGMLANRAIIETVAAAVRAHGITNLVVDPVMVAQSGAVLLEPDARQALLDTLFPLAALVTPNAPEAATLLGMAVENEDDLHEAARRLFDLGARAVLVKGGHVSAPDACDVLFDARGFIDIRARRVRSPNTHGTGCMLSAAIAARLAYGDSLVWAARTAKEFISRAIESGLALGAGRGPANALAWLDITKS